MFSDFQGLKEYCEKNDIRMIDFRMTDLFGRTRHVTIPVERLKPEIFSSGIGFDGSNYGFARIEKSDMVFIPDLSTSFQDFFSEYPTIAMVGDVYLTENNQRFEHDPRYIAKKAEDFLLKTGIADRALISPEFEFYVFDHISYSNQSNRISVEIDAENGFWNSGDNELLNSGYINPRGSGYHIAPPSDRLYDLRSEISILLQKCGIEVKYHHHEVGGPGQLEIELEFGGIKEMADKALLVKYLVKNTAFKRGKTATFMPKPLFAEAGNGMHVHILLFKDNKNLFYSPEGYSQLSNEALYFMGGILKHSPALMAFTNPSTNSYKRLVPGYEAPVSICFGVANRSSVIRIPGYVKDPEKKRFEFRPSDATSNPYLAFAALLMAGIDGIKNKIHPEREGFGPYDCNIFELPPEQREKIGNLPSSLEEALLELEKDYQFLINGGVFPESFIKNWIEKKRDEARQVAILPHPKEYELYYDL